MQVDDVKPQHDLDERKRLGREIGLENARRAQREAGYQVGWNAAMLAMRPYLDNAFNSLARLEEVLGR